MKKTCDWDFKIVVNGSEIPDLLIAVHWEIDSTWYHTRCIVYQSTCELIKTIISDQKANALDCYECHFEASKITSLSMNTSSEILFTLFNSEGFCWAPKVQWFNIKTIVTLNFTFVFRFQ